MHVIVTGAAGQLGQDVVPCLVQAGHTPIPTDIADLDITRRDDVLSFFAQQKADAVIHCAAFTAVDRAEDEPQTATQINAYGTQYIAEAAEQNGMKMLYVSTDYVYPGRGWLPQTEQTPAAPCNVYGSSKYAGELAAKVCSRLFIVRTSWVFGLHGNNFVNTMLRLSETRSTLSVVVDQIGSPTFTEDLAPLLCRMIETDKYGIYNASNEGFCSWYAFAREIFRAADRAVLVLPISSETYCAKAVRPKNSRMSKEKLRKAGFSPLPAWQDALSRYLQKAVHPT